jgi:hypothetical protein
MQYQVERWENEKGRETILPPSNEIETNKQKHTKNQ